VHLREVLSKPRSVVKLAVIGSLVLCIVGSFACGWLSGVEPSASRFTASEPMFFCGRYNTIGGEAEMFGDNLM
jgi:hypothetical protein